MYRIFQTLTYSLLSLGLSAQSISQENLEQLKGSWSGTLTYTDYRDDTKQVTLQTSLMVEWKGDKGLFSFEYTEPNGDIVTGESKFKLLNKGQGLNYDGDKYEVVEAKSNQGNSNFNFVLQKNGEDNDKPAIIRQELVLIDEELQIIKQVKYQNSNEFFQRNRYQFVRD